MKLEGKNAVREALLAGTTIDKILVQNGSQNAELINLAKQKGLKLQFANKQALDEQSATGHHQGIIAFASEFKYSSVDDIIKFANSLNQDLFVLILDGIEDPHNLGSILRIAECAGVHGVIIPKNRAVSVTETVVRVSAGATERVKVARVTNINDEIKNLQKQGVFVFSADMHGEPMYNTNLTGSIGIVIGSEGLGVKQLTNKLVDGIISIPMYGKINSLNASVSAGVVVYEAVRQRNLVKRK